MPICLHLLTICSARDSTTHHSCQVFCGTKFINIREMYEDCSESKERLHIHPRAVVSLYQISHVVYSVKCR